MVSGAMEARLAVPVRRVPLRTLAVAAAGVSLALLVSRDGTPGWRLVRLAVVMAVGVGTAATVSRPGAAAGALQAAFGAVAAAVGAGFLPYLVKGGPALTAIAALGATLAGVGLVAAGTRRAVGPRRWPGRAAGGLVALAATALAVMVVTPAVVATNVAPSHVGATLAGRRLDHESVTLTTADGVELAAWFVPSRTGAAVVVRHGAGSTRSNVLTHAEVLAARGFGVLLVDARGHGDSGGRAMDFGWYGDVDIAAATDFLAGRDGVDPDRIGIVGMSMGGEEAIGAAGTNRRLRAVVAEGATARTAGDKEWLSDRYGLRGFLQEQIERLQYGLTDLLTGARPPTGLRDAVARSGTTRFLLITAGRVADEGAAAAFIAGAAPDRVATWTVPGTGHTGGLRTQPDEWERRVVEFLQANL